jgi:hypothetical protein
MLDLIPQPSKEKKRYLDNITPSTAIANTWVGNLMLGMAWVKSM